MGASPLPFGFGRRCGFTGCSLAAFCYFVAPAFAGSLDRRFADLVPDLPFPKRFRIPRITAFF
jgi:hypothetical protein